jgi:hypothetical protein
MEPLKTVASEGRLRDAGAQEAERTRQYVSIPSTAGTQAAERSRFSGVPSKAGLSRVLYVVVSGLSDYGRCAFGSGHAASSTTRQLYR